MSTFQSINILCTFLLFLLITTSTLCAVDAQYSYDHDDQHIKGAYWPSGRASYLPPSAIDTNLFTHIYYAFLLPSNVTFKFTIDNTTALQLVNFTSTLHAKNPPVKVLFSIGGGGDHPPQYSQMVSTPTLRRNFILSTIEVARKFGFDGIDFDWEYPQNPQEMDDYSTLIEEWRAEVVKESEETNCSQLLLSAAVYFSSSFFLQGNIFRTYPVDSINRNLDWINAMCYDYHGSWEPTVTGSPSALFDPKSKISTSYGLGSWIKAGILRDKLVMGLPLYGKTWTLKDPWIDGVGAPAINVGPSGPGGNGTLFYYEVEQFNEKHNATVKFDKGTLSTYSVAGNVWIGYDDRRSTALRVEYAQALRIRGYFFWALSFDRDWQISKTASRLWA